MPCSVTEIVGNEALAPGVHRLRARCAAPERPGQFYMLRGPHGAALLPRPISLCDYRGGVACFAVQAVGRGTRELAGLRPGDALQITGPLGNGYDLDELAGLAGPVALVGGGIGVAPAPYLARALADRGVEADAFLGYRDGPFLDGEVREHVRALAIATETGRAGRKGFVTALFDPADYAAVLCCGPTPMMRAVVELCGRSATPVYVSLEQRMACGLGACLVCTCADKRGRNRRCCTDGPVFRGEEIDFDA